jgi:hypothetical protein
MSTPSNPSRPPVGGDEARPFANPDGAAKPPKPRFCRNYARRKVADAMPSIVDSFVQRAKDGSVPHFSSLAKFGGFDQRPMPSAAPKRRDRSLARQLLDEVDEYEARNFPNGPPEGC